MESIKITRRLKEHLAQRPGLLRATKDDMKMELGADLVNKILENSASSNLTCIFASFVTIPRPFSDELTEGGLDLELEALFSAEPIHTLPVVPPAISAEDLPGLPFVERLKYLLFGSK